MPEIFDVVANNGIQFINDIRANMGSAGINATNKTSHSLRVETKQEGTKVKMQLFGMPFFNAATRTGRKPTPGKKPSRDMISNLKQWVVIRGMDESAAWAVATNINKKGTKTWQQGGRTDIFEPALDDFINNVSQGLLDAKADDLILKIREMKW